MQHLLRLKSVCCLAATRWKDSVCTAHVEYDQRPDVFRYAIGQLWSLDVYV